MAASAAFVSSLSTSSPPPPQTLESTACPHTCTRSSNLSNLLTFIWNLWKTKSGCILDGGRTLQLLCILGLGSLTCLRRALGAGLCRRVRRRAAASARGHFVHPARRGHADPLNAHPGLWTSCCLDMLVRRACFGGACMLVLGAQGGVGCRCESCIHWQVAWNTCCVNIKAGMDYNDRTHPTWVHRGLWCGHKAGTPRLWSFLGSISVGISWMYLLGHALWSRL